MIPTYRYSQSSPMPIDLNYEDQTHGQLFSPSHQASSSSSSLSSSIFYNADQVQAGFNYYWEPKPLQSDEDQAEKIVPSSGSYDHTTEEDENILKLSTVWKKEEKDEEDEDEGEAENGSSVKWMSSKMRIMQKMMVSDQTAPDVPEDTMHKFKDQKQSVSPFGTDNSSNNSSYKSNFTIRVCSDCHTTKTPLWRSGPRGPKSLCNACGIRQRKARRAMAAAAAASANGVILAAKANPLKAKKFYNKEKKKKKKSKIGCSAQLKKKQKHGSKPTSRGRKKLGFEDFRIRLSKNLAIQQLVFPQDEKEAAILLMALSYGLVHG